MKNILIIFAFILPLFANAQMVTSITATMSADHVPTTAYVPVIASLTNPFYADFTVDVPGTLDNANDSLAFDAILDAIKDTIDLNRAPNTFALDTSKNIVGRIYVTSIIRQFDTFTPEDYKNQYQVATNVFRCRGRFKWVIN